ncbi:MAG: hypothetical protein N4A71_13330 [Carboxylicivirga sp.]|nr:hypothetical protein [Carboxylicivirga sp.]
MKIAIVILGEQNSGKTETLRKFVKTYSDRRQKQMRAGWRELSIYKEHLWELKLHAYFVPASPSETDYKLKDRIKDMGYTPEILFLAEQTDGHNRESTFEFLNKKEYEIIQFELSNEKGDGTWDRFNKSTESKKLNSRTQEINSKLKDVIKTAIEYTSCQ